jgi:chemotaxis protein histidine kinase CheA
MARTRRDDPAVTTYADHDIIIPPNRLRKAIGHGEQVSDEELIARADAALARLSKDFSDWMEAECDRLDDSRRAIKEHGIEAARLTELFRAAHDIKGEAETFGFPRAGEAAANLCRLIEHTPDMGRLPLSLVDQHVDAIRAIIREAPLEDSDRTATDLVARLRRVTSDFLAQIRSAPKATGESPPLAPDNPGSA